MIQVQNVSKSFGMQVLLDQASFLVGDHERVGLVGRNGCGKSTLFKMILGQECLDGGTIDIPKKYTIGYLQQHINFTHKTVHEEACSVLKPNEDGWIEEHKVEAILFGLGFDEESMSKDPMLLSGGFQIRLNLAKVLASEPDMLLLDEPTNYLDIVSMRWLSRFLRNWKGEVLLITHDHHFMDEVCTHTVGIHRHKIRKVKGTVEKLRETIAEEEEVAMRTQENEAKKKAQLDQLIERFRYKAAKAAMVQSKIKAAAKLANGERLTHERNLEFSFTEAPFPGKRMLQIHNLAFKYGDGPELFSDLEFEVFKGDRIAIIGPNGRGKTTLLNLIAKELNPTTGEICHNPNLQINYFGQTNINRLNLDNSVEEEIASAIAEVSQKSRARGLAGLMMFSGDNALKKIKVLSGGERSRVLLGKILASQCNMLLLDEPTNHLDMESIESLIDALDDYEGTAMVVTHDEELLHAFANRLVVFDGGKCRIFEGSYADFLEKVGWAAEKKPGGMDGDNAKLSNIDVTKDAPTASAAPSAKMDRKARADYIAERSKIIKPLEKAIAKIEDDIAKAEELSGALEAKLVAASESGDGNAITSIAKEMDDIKKKIDDLYTQYEVKNAELEAANDKYPLD
ncbi:MULTISPECIES: ABC-F family ATP-binding cassette domain-containing protein [unclassified Fibrobacter]|uniref:ABC-F family ATP-binding cassette domain-containing protein n=1 Tax=unclassified Fibrobacter TaxID=2634177 RepID=UPI000D7ACA1C|nr:MULTISPECIES: ABC-F family ATP-binding cassette domain-containing protein [unclassified Fibrobacter]PWJ64976.1 ATP-binding cassette subfamily F protein 3 [Fibrobacter sp. UWR4]PZW69041.1 ATP-binding cassette subfamily F protein 3 [Fibrobacter sp. UWR1]